MKKNIMFVFLFLSIFVFGNSNLLLADTTVTFTADNEILAWWGYDGSTWIPLPLDPANRDDWTQAETHTVGNYEQFIWQVVNSDRRLPSAINPGGFLGEIEGVPTSSSWDVAFLPGTWLAPTPLPADFNSLTWSPASTAWADFGGPYTNDDNTSLWYSLNGGPIAGISLDSQWIWTALNDGMRDAAGKYDSVFIRVTHPVPEPATMILLGSGLFGLGLLRRKFKK